MFCAYPIDTVVRDRLMAHRAANDFCWKIAPIRTLRGCRRQTLKVRLWGFTLVNKCACL
jgi:hypothetical protein